MILIYLNGKRAIVLSIIKQADARVYELKDALEKVTSSFNEDYPDLEFSTNQDQTKLLKLSIDNLKSSLWIGSLLAIMIMFFFLKDVKSPLIIAVSIAISLVISVLFMYLFGLSINIISLSGLILGVGIGVTCALNASEIVMGLEALLGFSFLSSEVYPIDYLPSVLVWRDVLMVVVAALILNFTATLYPAIRAAKTRPAEVLRYE